MVPDDQPFAPLFAPFESADAFAEYVQDVPDSELTTFMLALALGLAQEITRRLTAE